MILTGFARLGGDAQVRDTGGDKVANLSLAYNHGRKDADGKRPTQWVDAALWGKRAEALAPYLKKGQGVDVVLDDVHIETYEGRNGPAHKLVGRVLAIELTGKADASPDGAAQPARAQTAPAQTRPLAAAPAAQPPIEDDEIPF